MCLEKFTPKTFEDKTRIFFLVEVDFCLSMRDDFVSFLFSGIKIE